MIIRTVYKQPSYRHGDTILTAREKIDDVYAVGDTVWIVDALGAEIARWEVVGVEGRLIEVKVLGVG